MTTLHTPATFYPSDTWEIEGKLHDADGAPLNLTGAALRWKLELNKTGAVAVVAMQDNGITVLDAAGGEILIAIPPDQNKNIAPGIYVDQLQVEVGGVVSTQWSGTIDIKKSFFAP